MSEKKYEEFYYIEKEDYDKSLNINDEKLMAYSRSKLNDLYPDKGYVVAGETFENKKRDKEKDIGRIELNEKRLNVSPAGTYNKLFKTVKAYVEVSGGKYISILRNRILPWIILGVLLLGIMGTGIYFLTGRGGDNQEKAKFSTVSGIVTVDGRATGGIRVSLRTGESEIQSETTDKNGKYTFAKVDNGNYNLVCTYEESVQTELAVVDGEPVTVDFDFTGNSNVKAMVKMTDKNTPPVAVGGLSAEASLYAEENKNVDLTLFATKKDDRDVPETEKTSITKIAGGLDLTYYDFSVLLEVFKNSVLENSEYIKNTENVLEIAIPFDSSDATGTYVIRYHGDSAHRFNKLAARPSGNLQDGTYYVTKDTVYIYTNCFSTYAIGVEYGNGSKVIKPDYDLEEEDENQEPIETEEVNIVRLIIPSGKLYFNFKLQNELTGTKNITLKYTSEGNEYQVYSGEVEVKDGGISETEIDFTQIHNELVPGTYDGRILLKVAGNIFKEIKIRLYIVNAQGGKIGMGYSTKATVDLETGNIEMMYTLNMDATHNAILQLIIVKGSEEYCIAQSGIITVGHKLQKMTLADQYKSMLEPGHYTGILRLNLYNEDNPIVGMQPEAEIDIVVK